MELLYVNNNNEFEFGIQLNLIKEQNLNFVSHKLDTDDFYKYLLKYNKLSRLYCLKKNFL